MSKVPCPLCSLPKRIYVHDSVYAEFVKQYVDLVKVNASFITLITRGAHMPVYVNRNMFWGTLPNQRLPLDQS